MNNQQFDPSPEQEAIADVIISGTESLMIQAGAGTGKCLGKGTPVMLFNGDIIPVEKVRQGQILMGPDSLPRFVWSTSKGYGPLYKIYPVKGDSWVCNDAHILTLMGTNRKMGQVIDTPLLTALDNVDSHGRPDKIWKLFRVPVDFQAAVVPLDPYLAGTWLGDGTFDKPQWTFGLDKKNLAEYVISYGDSRGLSVNAGWVEKDNCYSISFAGTETGQKEVFSSVLLENFRENDSKIIPTAYLHNTRAIRESILAGILDTDGNISCGGVEITTKYERLREDILFLSRSLGLAAYWSEKEVRLEGWACGRTYYRVFISGDLSYLPFLRLKPEPRNQVKDVLKTGWTAEYIGSGEYYGFTLSGDGRFLLGDFTVTHNTTTLLWLLKYMHGSVFIGAFNKSIQMEIQSKVADMKLDCDVVVKTIHAAGLNAYKPNYKSQKPVIESNKVRLMLDELGAKPRFDEYIRYQTFFNKLIGFCKRAGVGIESGDFPPLNEEQLQLIIEHYSVDDELPGECNVDEEMPKLLDMSLKAYSRSLELCTEEIDFDDMLLAPLYFGSRFRQYDWVIIDEMQDCSAVRQEIAVRQLKKGGRMIAVGDVRQCIYGFSGCKPNEMDILRDRMKMVQLPLMTTFRCPKIVVRMAQALVPEYKFHELAPEGEPHRQVWLEPEVCGFCGGAVTEDGEPCGYCKGKKQAGFWDEARNLGPDDVILCRNNKPLVELAYQLLRAGIPCQIEGRDFAGSLIKLCQKWAVRELSSLEDKLIKYREKEAGKWRKKGNEERAVGIEDKIDTLLCLLDAVRKDGKTQVRDLIDKINLMFGDTEAGTRPKTLTLSSIHKSKGKEWNRVFMLGRARYMPSKWAKKDWEVQCEEINLPYVMLTRARKQLVDIVVPAVQRRNQYA